MLETIETALDGGSGAVITALDFLLQPLDYQEVEVPQGSSFEYVLRLENSGDAAIWKFETLDYDISFSVRFEDEQFYKATLLDEVGSEENEQNVEVEDESKVDGRNDVFPLER
jgi:hypothetical protein